MTFVLSRFPQGILMHIQSVWCLGKRDGKEVKTRIGPETKIKGQDEEASVKQWEKDRVSEMKKKEWRNETRWGGRRNEKSGGGEERKTSETEGSGRPGSRVVRERTTSRRFDSRPARLSPACPSLCPFPVTLLLSCPINQKTRNRREKRGWGKDDRESLVRSSPVRSSPVQVVLWYWQLRSV